MKKSSLTYYISYILWLLLFVILPLVLLLLQALTNQQGNFTLDNFLNYLSSGTYLRMTLNSIFYAFLITLITLIISYPMAYFLTQLKNHQFWMLLVILPTWINLLLKAYAFIGLLSQNGTINSTLSFFGIVPYQLLFTNESFLLVSSYIEIPFMILPIYNSLIEIDSNLIQASQDLGANTWQTIKNVIFPLSLNGVRTGIQVVFIPSLSLFMITRLIGGNRVITLGTAIEEHFLTTQNWHMGSTIGVVLVIAMLVTTYFTREGNKKGRKK
ncbi:MAG: ABC transporter permease [Lactobacillaceae bacterium]|jgi:spermidine/putrescine transport system permease protein|nr:ABC transporter permease [Lactobacillaceae bacterium]